MSELKPCPFCGSSSPALDYYEISCPQELGTIVVCNDCGASATSIVGWNTRPNEDALTAALREANEDAARLAHSNTWVQVDDDGISAACIHCGKHAKYERDVIHRPDCPITLHRARVGGGE